MSREFTVLILDHDPVSLESVARCLAGAMTLKIISTTNAISALDSALRYKPEVAVIARNCNLVEGVEISKLLAEVSPGTRVMVITEPQASDAKSAEA